MNDRIRTLYYLVPMLALTSFMSSALAQEVSIPDPGLNAAIRDALQITNGPLNVQDLQSLTSLDASGRNISSVAGLEAAGNLTSLFLEKNQLTNFVLLPGLIHLVQLDLSENQLTSLTLPAGLTNLSALFLAGNQLTTLTLPPDLGDLTVLDLGGNLFTSLTLSAGLTHLNQLVLTGNQLTNLTLPPDLPQLVELDLAGNPLTTLVLSEPLAASTNLAGTVASLQDQGVSVFTYPLTIQLLSPRQTGDGAFEFAIVGPPGVYTILGSVDLATWSELGTATNSLGSARFIDAALPLSPQKFYQARSGPWPGWGSGSLVPLMAGFPGNRMPPLFLKPAAMPIKAKQAAKTNEEDCDKEIEFMGVGRTLNHSQRSQPRPGTNPAHLWH